MQQLSITEAERIHIEVVKLMADTSKLNGEACKISREAFCYPVEVVKLQVATLS